MIKDQIEQMRISARKASNANGGVFHSACPECGGKDRFTIWEQKDRYWCRRCGRSGDAIQFLRDFSAYSFFEANQKVGYRSSSSFYDHQPKIFSTPFYVPYSPPPPLIWKRKASILTEHLNQRLLDDSQALKSLYGRGLTQSTIEMNQLGYLESDNFFKKEEWGLQENGKKLWIPKGHIIPLYGKDHLPFRIKIRKEQNITGKYYHLPGGASHWMAIYGNVNHPVVMLLESEFDAMLVIHSPYAKEAACCKFLSS